MTFGIVLRIVIISEQVFPKLIVIVSQTLRRVPNSAGIVRITGRWRLCFERHTLTNLSRDQS